MPLIRRPVRVALLAPAVVLLVGAVVAFMPLLWQIVDDQLAHTAATPGAAAASGDPDDWIVLAHDQPIRVVGQGVVFEGCITYSTPAGPQQTCKPTGIGRWGNSYQDDAECWRQARIGEPLPGCWR